MADVVRFRYYSAIILQYDRTLRPADRLQKSAGLFLPKSTRTKGVKSDVEHSGLCNRRTMRARRATGELTES
jgi:hypothetical protein